MFSKFRALSNPSFWLVPVVVLAIFLFHTFRLIDFHELEAVDLRFRMRGESKAHSDIVIVTIDDDSLVALGSWPWSRTTYAVFLDIVSRFGPRSIFFDVLLTEEGQDREGDMMLRKAMEKAGNVVLPFFYGSEKPFVALFPIDPLRKVAKGVGYINPVLDYDGRTRRFKTYLETQQGIFYHVAVLTVLAGSKSGDEIKPWLEQNFPLDSKKRLWIDFPGSLKAYRVVSFREVMEAAMTNRAPELKDLFSDRIVIVGHTATGTSLIDVKPTPFSPQEPGALIMAGAVHTLLSRSHLRSVPAFMHLLILFALGGMIALITHKTTPIRGLIITVSGAVCYMLLGVTVFILSRWILPLFVPVAVMLLSYFIILLIKHIEIRIQRELAERELKAASQIQSNFLPSSLPESENLDVAFDCKFSKTVGGDLYSWIDLGNDRFGFCVGDVSGKGMPASLYMSKCVSDFRSIDKRNLSPGKACSELNRILSTTGVSNMFLTLHYTVVDLRQKKILCSSAGHEHMLLYRERSKTAEIFKAEQGPPLGIIDGMEYETSECPIETGDAFLLVSDGVKELRNARKEEFGIERLQAAMERHAATEGTAKDMIHYLFRVMGIFQGGIPAHDDRTLLYVRLVKGER